MVDQLTLQTIGILLTGLTVSIAAIYYTLTLRYTRRNQELTLKAQEQALETRQAQLFMQIYDRWHDESFIKRNDDFSSYEFTNMDDFVEKYGSEGLVTGRVIGRYYEGIGVLVKRNLIDVTMVDDLMSGQIMRNWEKMEPLMKEMRMRDNWPQYAEYAEYLYREIKKIVEKQHPELRT